MTFDWEEAIKSNFDALIIPDTFPPIVNENEIPEIKIPTAMLIEKESDKIKRIIDNFFFREFVK